MTATKVLHIVILALKIIIFLVILPFIAIFLLIRLSFSYFAHRYSFKRELKNYGLEKEEIEYLSEGLFKIKDIINISKDTTNSVSVKAK